MRPRLTLLLVVAMTVSGCAGSMRGSVESTPSAAAVEVDGQHGDASGLATTQADAAAPRDEGGEQVDGVMHIVQPGQTLWRIARAYDVSLETIARVNGIADPTRVDVGVPIFIPGARATIDVAPYPAPPPSAHAGRGFRPEPSADFLWPVDGGEFMRPYGEPRRDHVHAGVDIRGVRGQAILASRDGVVAFSGRTHGGYGTMVILDHGDGVQTLYAHAQKTLVKAGDRVTRGTPIALVGRSGNATTEHCHFELRVANRPVDPIPYLQTITQASR
jgi:murein DD-endopeptidase MepM/ murein hydrolase activator NlpD